MGYSRDEWEENRLNYEGASGEKFPSYTSSAHSYARNNGVVNVEQANRYDQQSHRWKQSNNNNNNYKTNNMAYGQNNNQTRVSQDRFGNSYVLKTALQKTDKKTGELVNAYQVYVDAPGGKLLKIEISHRDKEHKSGKDGMWVKVTSVKKRTQSAGGGW